MFSGELVKPIDDVKNNLSFSFCNLIEKRSFVINLSGGEQLKVSNKSQCNFIAKMCKDVTSCHFDLPQVSKESVEKFLLYITNKNFKLSENHEDDILNLFSVSLAFDSLAFDRREDQNYLAKLLLLKIARKIDSRSETQNMIKFLKTIDKGLLIKLSELDLPRGSISTSIFKMMVEQGYANDAVEIVKKIGSMESFDLLIGPLEDHGETELLKFILPNLSELGQIYTKNVLFPPVFD